MSSNNLDWVNEARAKYTKLNHASTHIEKLQRKMN
jgi:hypothetical protein